MVYLCPSEFWTFVLINFLLSIGAMFLDNLFGFANLSVDVGPFQALYSLVMLIPALAVSVRRLHDIGKSGWFILVGLIPIIGFFWLLIYFLQEGTAGPNQYGPNPKEEMV